MKYNWWLWESGLSDEVVDRIVEKCELQPTEDGTISDSTKDPDIRISKVRWIDDDELRGHIWEYVLNCNENAFGFNITKTEFDIQYTTYIGEDKGFYDWHPDNEFTSEGDYDRKLTVVIQLNDPSDYEGGAFEFRIKGKRVSPEGFEKKGSIIAFPSFLEHRVTEVTKGTRNSLVSWIKGPHFK